MVKILMIHGFGTNASIFEAQTSPLRTLLPPYWHYHFVQAPLECGPAPGIERFYSGQTFRCWYHIPSLGEVQGAQEFLHDVIEDEGPFDVAWGFSGGAMILASLLLHHTHSTPQLPAPFRAAIFMNGYMPWSASAEVGKDVTPFVLAQQEIPCTFIEVERLLRESEEQRALHNEGEDAVTNEQDRSLLPPMLQTLHPRIPSSTPASGMQSDTQTCSDTTTYRSHRFFPELDQLRISIPTAHILGTQDSIFESGLRMTEMCEGKVMKVFKHGGGHEIPTMVGRNGGRELQGIREVIEKTVQRAEFG